MPCFKGIAVSIHANTTPLPEYGMQKQSRLSRISTYIPVPPPQLSEESNKPEPAKFAISITLLTPGLPIPYSTPKASHDNPYPKPQYVSGSAATRPLGGVTPYIPMTASENETIAAYIYFDGRVKEEVATLLRPGEETWVNSRWVQVSDDEGGGLAEREFLFREVGLERWLNGLDLKGHDAPEKLEKRRQKYEKRQRRQQQQAGAKVDAGDTEMDASPGGRLGTLRYGTDDKSPLEAVLDDTSSSSDDDDEPPEAAGQIKVSMFRVLASGEIKKGEYSPQFDAHDGDEDIGENKNSGLDADVEHTTSFAKPKTLDPKTISTQTVTGIDGPDKPYATFTFFYRGERQLQKVGMIPSQAPTQANPPAAKRRSAQLDFSKIGPLKSGGTVGFSAFRDQTSDEAQRRKGRKKSNGNIADDSDDDDDDDDNVLNKMDDGDGKIDSSRLAPEDAKSGGELADGVSRIRLKRAHSAEPEGAVTPDTVPTSSATDLTEARRASAEPTPTMASSATPTTTTDVPAEALVGSPLKKPRPSIDQPQIGSEKFSATQSLSAALDSVLSGGSGGAGGRTTDDTKSPISGQPVTEEEL